MQLEFATKQMTTAMKSVKKFFDKGVFADADPGCQDCLVASVNDGTAMLESAGSGLYTKATFPATVQEPGRIAINRTTLHALKLSGDRSTFKHADGANQMKFTSGQFTGELAVGQVFDEIEAARPARVPKLTMSMPALVAKASAKRTCLNTTLDNQPRMKLLIQDRKMTLSCNDSFRAAAVQNNLDEDSTGEGEIELPAVFFNTVLQAIEDTRVQIGFNDNVFRIAGGAFDVCHPVMQSNDKPIINVFDRFATLKQTDPTVVATVDTAMMRDAIGAVTSVAPSGAGLEVKLELFFSEKNNGQLTTAVKSASSRGKFHLPLRTLRINNRVPISLNARYIHELLNLMNTDEVEFYAWEQVVVLSSEKVGCCMLMPQLMKNRDED
jgi:DNA polymerase III sliding clamp (beta) subunit (PCNA family)